MKTTNSFIVNTIVALLLLRLVQAHVGGAGSCRGPGDSGGRHPSEPVEPPPADGGFVLERDESGALSAGQETRLVLRSAADGRKFTGFLVTAMQGGFLAPDDDPDADQMSYQLASGYSRFDCASGSDAMELLGESSWVTHTSNTPKIQTVLRFQMPEDDILGSVMFEYYAVEHTDSWYGPIRMHLHSASGNLEKLHGDDGAGDGDDDQPEEHAGDDDDQHEEQDDDGGDDDEGDGDGDDDDGAKGESSSMKGCSLSTMPGYLCQLQLGKGGIEIHWTAAGLDGQGAQQPNATVSFAVVAPTTGYVALSFKESSKVRMNPSDAVIGWTDADTGDSHVGGYRLKGYSLSDVQYSEELTALLQDASVSEADGVTTLRFSRPASAPGIVKIENSGRVFLNYAIGRADKLEIHVLKGQVAVDLLQGSAEATDITSSYLLHGGLMMSGWVVLAPTLAHVSRHKWLLSRGSWFTFHQWGAYGLSLMTFCAALVAFLDFDFGSGHVTHTVIGLFILGLLVCQVALGSLRPIKDSTKRRVWAAAHWWTGRSLLLLAFINCLIGTVALGAKVPSAQVPWSIAVLFFGGLQVAVAVVLEVLRRSKGISDRDTTGFVEMEMRSANGDNGTRT